MVPQILSFWNKLPIREQTSHCLVMMRERLFFPPLLQLYQLSAHTLRLKQPELTAENSTHRPAHAAPLELFNCMRRCVTAGRTQRTWWIHPLNSSTFPSNLLLLPKKIFLSLTPRIRNEFFNNLKFSQDFMESQNGWVEREQSKRKNPAEPPAVHWHLSQEKIF